MCCHDEKHGNCLIEYYGRRCPVCDCFCAHDNEPWLETTYQDELEAAMENAELDDEGEEY
jgi:hypothetical protein